MPQDQNRNDDSDQLSAQEFSAKSFGDPLLSLSSVWASDWMTQVSRLNAIIRKDSDLYKKLKAERRTDPSKFLSDILHSAFVLILSGSVLVSAYFGAFVLLGAAATKMPEVAAFLSSIEGTWRGYAVVAAAAILIGLGMLLTAQVAGWGLAFTKSSSGGKDPESFRDLLKIKPNQFHFGNLQVGYQISDGRLIVRSLGDEFYAVFKNTVIKDWHLLSEKDDKDFDADFGKNKGWYGEQLTSPLVLRIVASGLDKDSNSGDDKTSEDNVSELLIHGLQFEAPGEKTPAAHRAKLFGKKTGKKPITPVARGHT